MIASYGLAVPGAWHTFTALWSVADSVGSSLPSILIMEGTPRESRERTPNEAGPTSSFGAEPTSVSWFHINRALTVCG